MTEYIKTKVNENCVYLRCIYDKSDTGDDEEGGDGEDGEAGAAAAPTRSASAYQLRTGSTGAAATAPGLATLMAAGAGAPPLRAEATVPSDATALGAGGPAASYGAVAPVSAATVVVHAVVSSRPGTAPSPTGTAGVRGGPAGAGASPLAGAGAGAAAGAAPGASGHAAGEAGEAEDSICKETIREPDMLRALADHPAELDKYRRFKASADDPNTRECPYTGCGHMQSGKASAPAMRCGRCGKEYCFLHASAHVGRTCEAYEREHLQETRQNEALLNKEAKPCPKWYVGALLQHAVGRRACS
jgi:hypothetical protein